MRIDEFDGLGDDAARETLRVCADIPRWVISLAAARPYGSAVALHAAADELARTWTADEVDAALAQHPRIGDRVEGAGAEAAASRREQAGASGDEAVTSAIRAGNAEYEARFDRVFLIRAAGRDGAEILAELTRRLDNDPDAERLEVADQLRQIAMLRLAAAVPAGSDG